MNHNEYLEIKQVQTDLINKIPSFKPGIKADYITCAKLLGYWKNNNLDIEGDSDFIIFSDFAIFEKTGRGVTPLDYFYEYYSELTELEEEFLEGIINNYSSLFEIVNINIENHEVTLRDLFNENENIILLDSVISTKFNINDLFFLRVFPFRDKHLIIFLPFHFDSRYKKRLLDIRNEVKLQFSDPKKYNLYLRLEILKENNNK